MHLKKAWGQLEDMSQNNEGEELHTNGNRKSNEVKSLKEENLPVPAWSKVWLRIKGLCFAFDCVVTTICLIYVLLVDINKLDLH